MILTITNNALVTSGLAPVNSGIVVLATLEATGEGDIVEEGGLVRPQVGGLGPQRNCKGG